MAKPKLNPEVEQLFKIWQTKRKAIRARINRDLEGKNRREAIANIAQTHRGLMETMSNWRKGKTTDDRAKLSINRVIAQVDDIMRQSWEE